jgi:serine O-acetyltransferase
MFGNIKSDFKAYKRPLLAQGFYATLIHRYGTSARKIRFAPVRLPAKALHMLLIKFSEIFYGIYIGPNAAIGKGFVIEHFGGVIIHSDTRIGDNVRIRQGVTIGNKSAEQPNAVPHLGNRVDVGAGAKILGPITIGDDAVIGANAVVVKDVPAGATAVGIPARILEPRAPSMAATPDAAA